MEENLLHYLQQQIRVSPERLKRFTHDAMGNEYPQRFMFKKLCQYIDSFIDKKSANRMVLIPGFRGVGKTTMMAQVCSHYKQKYQVLFTSVEDVNSLFDMGIAELLAAYEDIIGTNLESIQKPILIFLDEVQADPKWAVTLKSLFERTSRVFFCCTGSSAVTLQSTSDLARRAIFEKMPPMCFTEYQMIKNHTYPTKGLKQQIQESIYSSHDADEVFNRLLDVRPIVNNYWSKVDRKDIRAFLSYGTLPFALTMPNESATYDAISLLLDKIIQSDLPELGNFTIDTLSTVKRILFIMAENDTTSLTTLEKACDIKRLTISNLFEALEKAELLIKVPAYGSNMSAAKKANKYLFMSPAIRMSFFSFTGIGSTYSVRQGKLFEDLVGGHLYREFIIKDCGAFRYDSRQGGADFILQIMNSKQIIIEAGIGKKDKKQIVTSMQKINSDYNLIFSNTELSIDRALKTIFVPLDYFLLM